MRNIKLGGVDVQLALMIIADIVILAILGIVVYKSVQNTTKSKVESLEKEAEEVLKRAERDAEAKKKEAILEAL